MPLALRDLNTNIFFQTFRGPPGFRERPPGLVPGFLVLGAAPAPASTFVLEPRIAPLGYHFASWALGCLLRCGARSSPTANAKTGRTAHVFTAQGGTRRGISQQNSGISRPKKFDFPGFEGHTELFGPHPFTWKTPTPWENIRTQRFGFVLFFRA